MISAEAAAYLSVQSDLLPHHVSSREVFADAIPSLLHEGGRVRSRVVRANDVKGKLGFLQEVVGQWVENGGLGRVDEDFCDNGEDVGKKLYWEGLTVKEGMRKVDRVTVGRCGGDEQVVAGR